MVDYTIVCGIDRKHLEQLRHTWPTWKKHKPDLLNHPMVIFYDYLEVDESEIEYVIDHPDIALQTWPPDPDVVYGDDSGEKWTNPQRVKMLSGFIYASAWHVHTKYWLKLDTDVVATGMPDWIDENWFKHSPAVVCPPWGFTRPAKQMLRFDGWVSANSHKDPFKPIAETPPLNLHPEPGAERVRHKRICSWCGFFQSGLSRVCVQLAEESGFPYQLPQATQDGYMWYVAKRLGLGITRVRMKNRGWQVWGSQNNLEKHSWEVMNNIEQTS